MAVPMTILKALPARVLEEAPPFTGVGGVSPQQNAKERAEAFEKLMQFKRKKVPAGFNYKKELMEAIDERFDSVD